MDKLLYENYKRVLSEEYCDQTACRLMVDDANLWLRERGLEEHPPIYNMTVANESVESVLKAIGSTLYNGILAISDAMADSYKKLRVNYKEMNATVGKLNAVMTNLRNDPDEEFIDHKSLNRFKASSTVMGYPKMTKMMYELIPVLSKIRQTGLKLRNIVKKVSKDDDKESIHKRVVDALFKVNVKYMNLRVEISNDISVKLSEETSKAVTVRVPTTTQLTKGVDVCNKLLAIWLSNESIANEYSKMSSTVRDAVVRAPDNADEIHAIYKVYRTYTYTLLKTIAEGIKAYANISIQCAYQYRDSAHRK